MRNMKSMLIVVLGALFISINCARVNADEISLAGRWRFSLDRSDVGIKEEWFNRQLPQSVTLPGSLPAQGIGDDITVDTKWTGSIVDRSWFTAPEYEKYRKPGNIKVPFWLQPDKYYVGAAWYQREVRIPESWRGKRIVLSLERPHWETRVWLDGKFIGSNNALSTPHVFDLGRNVEPGKHTLTIRVDNRMIVNVGRDAHSVSDHTQGNWNGIVGKMTLSATDPVWIDDIRIFPNVRNRSIKVKGDIGNLSGGDSRSSLWLAVYPVIQGGFIDSKPVAEKNLDIRWTSQGGSFETEIVLGESAKLWDEFSPNLYQLKASIRGYDTTNSVMFGLREVGTEGTQFTINGVKTFIRGTLDCCIYPNTGHPPLDVESWKKVIRTAKSHGLNLIRFHSWCPPEAAFIAADELGFYFHVECAVWTTVGDGGPVDQWLYDEANRIIKAYGNHPSFVFMLHGNEPGGKNHRQYLSRWVSYFKERDPRRLYSSGAGWPQIPENQFHVTPDPRIQAWGGGLKSRINAKPPETVTDYRDYINARTVPVISHEIGQWCVYPNFDEIKKYKGYLKPKNFEIFRDTLTANHMGDLARKFLMASGKLQTLCYKEDIESALRTPGMGGFELLDLHDFPGQGTALVGVLDPFWEPKGYVTAQEYSRFCNRIVPLARLPKRVFTPDENLEAKLEIANFGGSPLTNSVLYWRIADEQGNIISADRITIPVLKIGNDNHIADISVNLSKSKSPRKYKLIAGIENSKFENDWDIWVYPKEVDTNPPKDVLCVNEINDEAVATLKKGGKVILFIQPSQLRGDKYGKVGLGFSSIFWNTAWTRRQPPHTLGILCDPEHPLFSEFPTEYHSNWQWWYIISISGAMILNDMPPQLRPVIQVIDDWFTNRRLGIAFEARCLNGSIFVCSSDLPDCQKDNIVARQLLHCIYRYVSGKDFKPKTEVSVEQIKNLFSAPSDAQKLGARVIRSTPFEPDYEPENIFDNNVNTMWHSKWNGTPADFPHELVIELKEPVKLRGITLTPRQDGNPNGWFKEIEIYGSPDKLENAGLLIKTELAPTPDTKTVNFKSPVIIRYLRVKILSAHSKGPYASLAEMGFIKD